MGRRKCYRCHKVKAVRLYFNEVAIVYATFCAKCAEAISAHWVKTRA